MSFTLIAVNKFHIMSLQDIVAVLNLLTPVFLYLFIYLFTLYFKLTYTVKNITVKIK